VISRIVDSGGHVDNGVHYSAGLGPIRIAITAFGMRRGSIGPRVMPPVKHPIAMAAPPPCLRSVDTAPSDDDLGRVGVGDVRRQVILGRATLRADNQRHSVPKRRDGLGVMVSSITAQ
jgi:hypothetical protein